MINGHNRLRVLQALGRNTAKSIVWDIDDCQTRLYLATLNRLTGKDVPERRAVLVEALLKNFELEELTMLLPESREQIGAIECLAHIELEDIVPRESSLQEGQAPVIIDFMLREADARQVNLAIDVAINNSPERLSRAQALVEIVRFYLSQCTPNSTEMHCKQ